MKLNLTQNIWALMSHEEKNLLTKIHKKRTEIEENQKKQSELHDDVKITQRLLTVYFRERYEHEGFIKGVRVKFKGKGSKEIYTFDGMFFDEENNQMAVMLHPQPKLGLFKMPYVFQLKIVKEKEIKKKVQKNKK